MQHPAGGTQYIYYTALEDAQLELDCTRGSLEIVMQSWKQRRAKEALTKE